MNTGYEEQQIADIFADQAGTLGFDDAPFEAIVGRGRAHKRRRTAMRSAAALVVVAGATYGSVRLLRPSPDRLAVTTATTAAAAPSQPSTVPTTMPSPESTPASVAPSSVDTVPSDQLATEIVDNPDLARGRPVAYRDGFLLAYGTLPEEPTADPATVSLVFTSDGTDLRTVGAVEVAGSWSRPSVDGDSVVIGSITEGEFPAVHLYRSDDLTTWSHDEIDLTLIGPIADLTPAMRELVDVVLAPPVPLIDTDAPVINGEGWMMPIDIFPILSDDLRRQFDPDDTADVQLSRSGLTITTSGGEVTVVPPADLGVTDTDLDSYERATANSESLTISGRWGQPTAVVTNGSNGPSRDLVSFGNVFAGLDADSRILVSIDGRDWTPFKTELTSGSQEILRLAPLDGDLLVLTTDGDRTESYRLASDGATTLLGEVPLQPGYSLKPLFDDGSGSGVFRAWAMAPDSPPIGDVILSTKDYEITLVSNGEASDDSQVHYVVREHGSGDVVAEDERDAGDWQSGEPIDGVLTVVFTDSQGRPDVLIPVSEIEAAIDRTYEQLDAANPTAPDGGNADTASDLPVEIATGDGVHWYQNPDPDESTIDAANGTKFLITSFVGEVARLEVIDLQQSTSEP